MNNPKSAENLSVSRCWLAGRALALVAAVLVCAAGCSDDRKIVPTITDLRSPSPDLSSSDLSAATPDLSVVSPTAVVVNEVFPHGTNELTDPDWAELKNTSTTPMDLSGYRVRDDKTTVTLPAGTTVAPGQYLVMLCDDTPDGGAAGVIHLPFKFGGSDAFWLLSPDGTTVDSVTWKSNNVPAGKSYGRLPDGTGQFAAQTPTSGTANGV